MGYVFSGGGGMFISNDFDTPAQIVNITNAEEAEVTVSAGTFKAGDIVLLDTPGWEHATNTMFRIKSGTATKFVLEKLDTTDTNWYPSRAARGGTLMRVKTWTTIRQVLEYSVPGGDPKTLTVSPVFSNRDLTFINGYESMRIEATLGYDSKFATVYNGLEKMAISMENVAVKTTTSCGSSSYIYGPISFNNFPTQARNEPNKVRMTVSALGRYSNYR